MALDKRNSGGTVTQALQDMLGIISKVSMAMNSLARGNNLAKYWEGQSDLINSVTKAYERLNIAQKNGNYDAISQAADEFVKYTNALKAVSNFTKTDLSKAMPDYSKISKAYSEVVKVAQLANEGFSTDRFAELIPLFEMLSEKGLDVKQVFDQLSATGNTSSLRTEIKRLVEDLDSANNKIAELRSKLEDVESGSGISDLKNRIGELKENLQKQVEKKLTEKDYIENNVDELGEVFLNQIYTKIRLLFVRPEERGIEAYASGSQRSHERHDPQGRNGPRGPRDQRSVPGIRTPL